MSHDKSTTRSDHRSSDRDIALLKAAIVAICAATYLVPQVVGLSYFALFVIAWLTRNASFLPLGFRWIPIVCDDIGKECWRLIRAREETRRFRDHGPLIEQIRVEA